MLLCTEMHVLAGIFVFGCCSELLQVQENSVRAQQHGPCCTTRAPVFLFCVGKSNVFAGHITTRAVLHNTGTRVEPLCWLLDSVFLYMLLCTELILFWCAVFYMFWTCCLMICIVLWRLVLNNVCMLWYQHYVDVIVMLLDDVIKHELWYNLIWLMFNSMLSDYMLSISCYDWCCWCCMICRLMLIVCWVLHTLHIMLHLLIPIVWN